MLEIQQLIISIIQRFFKKYKIKYSKHDSYDLWLLHYFNFRLKFIDPVKRQVRISNELQIKLESHPKKGVLDAIILRTLNGTDLNPLQSKGSFDSDIDDGLFNVWGIHHLHLNISKNSPTNYFTNRSDTLVFVKFTVDTAYFIDIQPHNQNFLWSKKSLISIIQNNWNDLISDNEIKNTQITPDFNEEELLTLRNKGYMTGVNVNQRAYLLLGHGQTSSGDNMMAGRLTDRVIRWIGLNQEIYISDRTNFEFELLKKLGL